MSRKWFSPTETSQLSISKATEDHTSFADKFSMFQTIRTSWKHAITDGSCLGLRLTYPAQLNLLKGSKGKNNAKLISNLGMDF